MASSLADETDLVSAFQMHYYHFVQSTEEATLSPTNPTVLHCLGDQIDEYRTLVGQV